MPTLLIDGPKSAALTLALAHGAGAPMDSDWMNAVAGAIADTGVRVVRFEFPYMNERRETGKKRPPNPERVLLETWRDVITELGAHTLVIGGKSMGGRMASMVAAAMETEGIALDQRVRGLICLGYPFHPPGKPEKLRTEHLEALMTPTLICQGTRDALGTRAEIEEYRLSKAIDFCWLEDGDHGFKPRKASGRTEAQNWNQALDAIKAFTETL